MLSIKALAQTRRGLPTIGWLYSANVKAGERLMQAFVGGLLEHGYLEGRNVLMTRAWADGNNERIPALVAQLVAQKVDVIYAPAPPDTMEESRATQTIPIVFALIGDPVRSGVAKSLARPDGNLTGLSSAGPDLASKRYALLKEISPNSSRIAVLYDPTVEQNIEALELSTAPSRELGLAILPIAVSAREALESAFETVTKQRAHALFIFANSLFFSHRRRIAELAAGTRLPAMFARIEFVQDGGLVGYSVDGADQYRRAAGYVARILKGAVPGNLPIQQPTRFELHVNLKTAKALGIAVPQSILVRADRVFE